MSSLMLQPFSFRSVLLLYTIRMHADSRTNSCVQLHVCHALHVVQKSLQVIGLCHVFSTDNPEKARVMVWVLGSLTGLAG